MIVLSLVREGEPNFTVPPEDSVEHVYSAVETAEESVRRVVVYRTADKVTHKAYFYPETGKYEVVKSADKF